MVSPYPGLWDRDLARTQIRGGTGANQAECGLPETEN
jgi:hypothetical protein